MLTPILARTFGCGDDAHHPHPGSPPKHTRVRSLVQQAFTPERVTAMEPHILGVVRRMIDQIMASGNQCDFVRDFTPNRRQ